MTGVNPWQAINPEEGVAWVDFPQWAIPLLRAVNICDSELYVLLFLFSRVQESLSEVYAPTRAGVKYTCVNSRTYFRSVEKFKQMGMRKIGNGIYDLSGLIEYLKSQVKNLARAPLEEGVPGD